MKINILAMTTAIAALTMGTACLPTETEWYFDNDQDGIGNSETVETAVEAPNGYVAEGGDCDDDDPDNFPGNPEVDDDKDNNCDGEVDEGFGGKPHTKTIFVSSTTHTGGGLGGLAGADAICQSLASASALPTGTYKAWLSSSAVSASDRLTHAPVPYVTVNGLRLASNWDDLVDNLPLVLPEGTDVNEVSVTYHNILDENGAITPDYSYVWTGTDPYGMSNHPSSISNCLDWMHNLLPGCGSYSSCETSGSGGSPSYAIWAIEGTGLTGGIEGTAWTWLSPSWTGEQGGGGGRCLDLHHIYCVEQ